MLTRDVTEGTGPATAPPAPPRHRWWHASPAGLVVGTTFAALAMTPPLNPRDWTSQGTASGISAAIGYGIGAGGMAVVRWWRRRGSRGPGPLERLRERLGRRGRPVAWALMLVGLAALLLVVLLASAGWQQDLADLMGMEETTTTGWLRAGPATLVVALVVDRNRSQQAAHLLLDAVSQRVDAVPADSRPRLLVYGESLAVVGTQAAFTSLSDVRDRTDGVVWAGPPGFSSLWSSLVARRDPGTRAVAPVYADALVVRFAQRPGDEDQPATPWLDPRVLYLQHASDPVVWWSPSLIWSKPDWLSEERGADVLPGVRWYPVVTFWQVSTDRARAQVPPDGHGHDYGDEQDTARLHEVFER